MKSVLKNAREQKGFTTRQVSETLGIDQALISKFENGLRRPTENQLRALSTLLHVYLESLMIAWLKEKILDTIGDNAFGLQALKAVEQEISKESPTEITSDPFQKLLNEWESSKRFLNEKKKKTYFLISFLTAVFPSLSILAT